MGAENFACAIGSTGLPDSCARRILAEVIVTLPIQRWSDRPRGESSAAVGAHVAEDVIHARCAERAFIRADTSVDGFRWKRCVAVFAGRSEFEHRAPRRRRNHHARGDIPERLTFVSVRVSYG